MEKGKLYISKSIKCIVECTKDSSNIDNFFNGNVVKCDSGEYNIGYYSTTWIKDCFTEYIQPATSVQIGGNHYKDCKIQPTEFIHANNIPFIEGNIIKYVIRHKSKNGIEDLKKARHYIDLLINFEYESKESL